MRQILINRFLDAYGDKGLFINLCYDIVYIRGPVCDGCNKSLKNATQ